MNGLTTACLLLFCHLIGDYVLQSEFLANTKGSNWYHLFIHSALYCVPFYFAFGTAWVAFLLPTHFVVDALKARYKRINYAQDQVVHYLIIAALFILLEV